MDFWYAGLLSVSIAPGDTPRVKNGSPTKSGVLAYMNMEASRVRVAAICHVPCFFIAAIRLASTFLSRTLCASPLTPYSTSCFASSR